MNRIQIELMNKLARGCELYETIRTIPPVEHQRIWMESLRGEYTICVDKAYLPAWEGFESILDVADIATHRGIELPIAVHIEQMRN